MKKLKGGGTWLWRHKVALTLAMLALAVGVSTGAIIVSWALAAGDPITMWGVGFWFGFLCAYLLSRKPRGSGAA